MGGGSATTWASVDGKPNKPFMSGMRARGRDAATRAALLRNKDAPEGLVRLRSDLSNALGATHTVVGRKGTSTTRLGEMRRGAIKRSAMIGLEFIYTSQYEGKAAAPTCRKDSCSKFGGKCPTPWLHSSHVQAAMPMCPCVSKGAGNKSHTRAGCLNRPKAPQAPEDQVEAAIELVYEAASTASSWVKSELVAADDIVANAEKAWLDHAAADAAAQANAAAAAIVDGGGGGRRSNVGRAVDGVIESDASLTRAILPPTTQSGLLFAPRAVQSGPPLTVQSRLPFAPAASILTTPHIEIDRQVQSALQDLEANSGAKQDSPSSVFGKGVTVGSHEGTWWRERMSKHLRQWVDAKDPAMEEPACPSLIQSSGRGMTLLPTKPELDAYYANGLKTNVFDWEHPQFRSHLLSHGLKCTPCGLPGCEDAVTGHYRTRPASAAAGFRNDNWSSNRSQPFGIVGPDGRMSPAVSAVSFCEACMKSFRHSSRWTMLRLPYELQALSPVNPEYGHRGQERWLLGRGVTGTMENDLTTGQGFAAVHAKLLDSARLANDVLHRAYNSAALSYQSALEAAVGDARWALLGDSDRLDLVAKRAEHLFLQCMVSTDGVGLPVYRTDGLGSAAESVPPASGPSSIEEAFLAAAQSRRSYRVRYQNAIGVEHWCAIDLTKRSGKKFGDSSYWLATMTSDAGHLVATTVVSSTDFSAIRPWLEAIASRPSWNPKGNKLGVCIDNVPPAGDNSKSAFIQGHLDALKAHFVVQDKYHVRQNASMHFNNVHPRFFGAVIQGIRNATSRLDPTLEDDLDARLRGGFVFFKTPRVHRGVTYHLPRKKVLSKKELAKLPPFWLELNGVTHMTEAQRDDTAYPSGTVLTEEEIATWKASGSYQEFFSRDSTVVPLVAITEGSMRQRMKELTDSIELEFFKNGEAIKDAETGKVLIATVEGLRNVMTNCTARAVNTIVPESANVRGFSPTMEFDPKTGKSSQKICQSTGMGKYNMDYHSSGNESMHARLPFLISGDSVGPGLGTALYYEGTPRLNRNVDNRRGRPTLGHDQPWVSQSAQDMEERLPGLFAPREGPLPMFPGLPTRPTATADRADRADRGLTEADVANYSRSAVPLALGGHGMSVGGFDSGTRKRGDAAARAEPHSLPAVPRAVAFSGIHASGDPGTVALHAKAGRTVGVIRAVLDSADTIAKNSDFSSVKRQHVLHLQQIIKECRDGITRLEPEPEPESPLEEEEDVAAVASSATDSHEVIDGGGIGERVVHSVNGIASFCQRIRQGVTGPMANMFNGSSVRGSATAQAAGGSSMTPAASASVCPSSPVSGGSPTAPAASASVHPSSSASGGSPTAPAAGTSTFETFFQESRGTKRELGDALQKSEPKRHRAESTYSPTDWPCTCNVKGMPLYPATCEKTGELYQYNVRAGAQSHRSSCAKKVHNVKPKVNDMVVASEQCGVKAGKSLTYLGQGKGRWKGWAWSDGSWAYLSDKAAPTKTQMDTYSSTSGRKKNTKK